jgi:hypothetical protein
MRAVTADELELRRRIVDAFARDGTPPAVDDGPALRGLVKQHVVVLNAAGQVHMAHPFAGHRDGARVARGERTWWDDIGFT